MRRDAPVESGERGGRWRAAAAQPRWPGIAKLVIAREPLSRAGLVPRRQVRDLGALGSAMPARVRRLVRAADVHAGALAVACRAKRRTSITCATTAIRAAPASSTSSDAGRPSIGEPEDLLRRYARRAPATSWRWAATTTISTLFASQHHEWNSTRVGPKRDILGTWEPLVREAGLKFGVSNHSSHAWHWYQVAYGYDAEGPMRGRRYDAYWLRKKHGRGKFGRASTRRSSTPDPITWRRTASPRPPR